MCKWLFASLVQTVARRNTRSLLARGVRILPLVAPLFSCGLLTGVALAQTSGYWHTSGNQILDSSGSPVRIAGLNWYGFETTDGVGHGLWSQDYKTILGTIRNNGYNVVRLPFSNQMVEMPSTSLNIQYSNSSGPINTDLRGLNSLQVMDKVIAYAGQLGLRIILDNHRSSAGSGTENGLWYTTAYPESAWLQDWRTLTNRYLNNATVIGMDLRNEPHDAQSGGSCWDCGDPAKDWHLAAQRGGNAILAINPNLLIFVEGTDCYNGDCYWWGGNTEGVATSPVTLSVANRLVYSVHDYGPDLSSQSWFNGSTTYTSLAAEWTKVWGYISQQNLAPVWVGEFGTTNDPNDVQNSAAGSQGQWFQSLITYLQTNSTVGWTYWALNGEDSFGLLDNNYSSTPVSSLKQQMLAGIQSPITGGGGDGGGTTTPTPTAPGAPTALSAAAVSSSQVNLTWTASATGGVTYRVYGATTSGFTPSSATLLASNVTATTFSHQGLSAATTYYYLVTATNRSGESTASNQASATTGAAASGSGACQATLTIANDWGSGFTAALSIKNTSSAAVNGWTLTFTWPGNQTVTQSWNSTFKQSGKTVSFTNASHNAAIAPGATLTDPGFNVTYSGANTAPAAFYLNGAQCNTGGGSITPTAPAAPASLTASTASSSQINLSWAASTTAGVTYNVYASTSSGFTPSTATRLATGITGTSYQASGLQSSTNYYFLVTAVNGAGESAASTTAMAITSPNTAITPNAPTSLSAAAVSSSQIHLSWTASTTVGVTYNVYAGTTNGFKTSTATRVASNIAAVAFDHTALSAGTTYYYRVTAVNAGVESAATAQVSATTETTVATSACRVTYVNQSDWGTGFTASVSITNTGSKAIDGWTLSWTWSGNQQLTNAWNGSAVQTGTTVKVINLSYNGSISAGGTVTGIGFNGSYSGVNQIPSIFFVNGNRCVWPPRGTARP